jgi:hypothetical protein
LLLVNTIAAGEIPRKFPYTSENKEDFHQKLESKEDFHQELLKNPNIVIKELEKNVYFVTFNDIVYSIALQQEIENKARAFLSTPAGKYYLEQAKKGGYTIYYHSGAWSPNALGTNIKLLPNLAIAIIGITPNGNNNSTYNNETREAVTPPEINETQEFQKLSLLIDNLSDLAHENFNKICKMDIQKLTDDQINEMFYKTLFERHQKNPNDPEISSIVNKIQDTLNFNDPRYLSYNDFPKLAPENIGEAVNQLNAAAGVLNIPVIFGKNNRGKIVVTFDPGKPERN